MKKNSFLLLTFICCIVIFAQEKQIDSLYKPKVFHYNSIEIPNKKPQENYFILLAKPTIASISIPNVQNQVCDYKSLNFIWNTVLYTSPKKSILEQLNSQSIIQSMLKDVVKNNP